MSAAVYSWLTAAHLIGVFFWMGGLMAVYWLLRIHTHAPKEAHDKLTLMERSLALMMDISSALAIGAGLAMAIGGKLFTTKGNSWLHIKLTIVVFGILSVHGMVRAKVAKFSRGEHPDVPAWHWSVLVASIVAIIILVTRVRFAMMRG